MRDVGAWWAGLGGLYARVWVASSVGSEVSKLDRGSG